MKKILVHAVPNSRSNEIIELAERAFKVKIAAPPIGGKANKELIKMLAKHFGVHRNEILILEGITSRKKIIGIKDE
jgi:hypothetical protein